MLSRPVDLSACDSEPIHHIGAVQPHGALIAVDEATGRVVAASLNVDVHLGFQADAIIGRPLHELIGAANAAELVGRDIEPRRPELIRPWFLNLSGEDGIVRALECFPHRHEGRLILEFVPHEAGPAAVWEEDLLRQRIIGDLIRRETLEDLASAAADILREVTGFDRVMIYRFAPDKHGEVIAESTVRPDSFLGMHYPASDIPDPARRHFLLNVIRSIPDINAVPSPIVAKGGAIADFGHPAPIDLTFSKLRAVAPVHVEYLNNMGVGGSMSISLTANDHLWGLVACHHYGPLHLPWSRFRFCELLGGTMSALLQSIENAVQLRQSIRAERTAHEIERGVRAGTASAEIIARHADDLMLHANALGMDLVLGGQRYRFGRVPAAPPAYPALGRLIEDGVAATDYLAGLVPLEGPDAEIAAGAAYLELSGDGADYLVFLREAYVHTIRWAGKPEKVELETPGGSMRLSPRGSFALWSEERRGRSRPFLSSDLEALRIVRRVLFALVSLERERSAVAAQKQAEQEEARLRLVVMEAARRSSLGELASALAHELNQPLAAVTAYVSACRQELRNYGLAVPEPLHGLIESAVGEASRAAKLVRRLRNFIAEGEIIADWIDLSLPLRQGADLALAAAGGEPPMLTFDIPPDLPRVSADPLQIGQVVLNLVRNALPAMEGAPERRLHIAARQRGADVVITVEDSGHGIPEEIRSTLFEPFHGSTTHGMGIGLSLCRSIVEAHGGRIAFEPLAVGTRFSVTLPIEGPRP